MRVLDGYAMFAGAVLALADGRYEHCWSEAEKMWMAETLIGDREGEVVLSLNYLSQRSVSLQSLSECYDEKSLTDEPFAKLP